jgi:hypothetical protein
LQKTLSIIEGQDLRPCLPEEVRTDRVGVRRMSIDYAHNARALKSLRNWSAINLPLYGSFIGYDLAIQILESSSYERGSSLKEIYHSMSHSEPQIRRKLRVFEADGWIRIRKSICDQRNSLVEPTEKMLGVYEQYFILISELCMHINFTNSLTRSTKHSE